MSLDIPTHEKCVLYADKRKALADLNKRMLFTMAPPVMLMFLLAHTFAHGFTVSLHAKSPPHLVRQVRFQPLPIETALFSWFPWFLLAERVFWYAVVMRFLLKQNKPVVTLSADGMEVDTTGTPQGLIHWHEIEEVRSYTFIWRFVGIVPKNYLTLCQRLGPRRAWMVNINAICVPIYKPFGLFVAPINIPQSLLSITADELTARIHAYQSAYSKRHPYVLPAGTLGAGTDVWPPPPTEASP